MVTIHLPRGMLLTLHAATGALVGELTPNPALAFLFGFLSHFPLDAIPHGDRAIAVRAKTSDAHVRRYLVLTAIDTALGFTVLGAGFAFGRFDRPWSAYLGMLGGILPDAIIAVPQYVAHVRRSVTRRFRRFHRFHDFNHNEIITSFDVPMHVGYAVQVVLLVVIWRLW